MNAGKKVKNILFIAISIFIVNYLVMILGKVFSNQIIAFLPNYYYRNFAVQLVQAVLTVALIFIFHKTHVFKFNGRVLKYIDNVTRIFEIFGKSAYQQV